MNVGSNKSDISIFEVLPKCGDVCGSAIFFYEAFREQASIFF